MVTRFQMVVPEAARDKSGDFGASVFDWCVSASDFVFVGVENFFESFDFEPFLGFFFEDALSLAAASESEAVSPDALTVDAWSPFFPRKANFEEDFFGVGLMFSSVTFSVEASTTFTTFFFFGVCFLLEPFALGDSLT